MLYVFQMDVGQMLTFDISLLMDSVSRLQLEIARVTGVAVDQQILLLSGGHSLHPDQKVMTYGAGADTNPVFLFSKLAITSQEPPLVKSFGVPKDELGHLKARVLETLKMPAGFETVAARTKVAGQIKESATQILRFCNGEFKEQHLQHQGWSAVVANLEEIAQALQKTKGKFTKVFSSFLPMRDKHFSLLSDFSETLDLLSRIPILRSLKDSDSDLGGDDEIEVVKKGLEQESRSLIASTPVPHNLLEWITTQGQGQSVEALQLKCYNDLVMFNEDMFDAYEGQVRGMLEQVTSDPSQMKELVGIERRLSDLEKRLNEAKKIAKSQIDLAQAFVYQQSRLTSTGDPSVLPDLCASHRRQLQQMWEGQQRIEALQNNFRKSKQEMSTNIHQRLGWVMHIETQISQLDSDLIFHMKTLKMLEMNLDLLAQVKAAPRVYADMIMEAARRKVFSQSFSEWANGLVEDSKQFYNKEIQYRNLFTARHGKHFFLHTLFRGFEDMPPNFATKVPPVFDQSLPSITQEEISSLRTSVPELEESLSVSDEFKACPEFSLMKKWAGSPSPHMILPNSQSSQTEWTQGNPMAVDAPCVITATEGPPTRFTLPELQDSRTTEYLPAVSSLTDTLRDDPLPAPATAPSPSPQQKDPKSSSSSSSDPTSTTDKSSSTDLLSGPRSKANSIPTESTSPPSSTEFATADFYFEDAMPSPMRGKSDSQTISSLQATLLEKLKRIQELESLLKGRGVVLCPSHENVSDESSSVTVVPNAELSDHILTAHSSETDNIEIVAIEPRKEADEKPSLSKANEEQMKGDLEQMQKMLVSKDQQVEDLKKNVNNAEADMVRLTCDLQDKDSLLTTVRENLAQARQKCDSLQEAVGLGETSLCRVRDRLRGFKDTMTVQIPSFRVQLEEMKTSVLANRTEVDASIAVLMRTVQGRVKSFNSTVLAEARKEFQQEKETLLTDAKKLQAELHAMNSEKQEVVSRLSQQYTELTSRMSGKEKDLTDQLDKQKLAFDSKLKEVETQHSLELEIELDKCRCELRCQLDEAETKLETLHTSKLELQRDLEAAQKEVARGLQAHDQTKGELLQKLEATIHQAEKEQAEWETAHKAEVNSLEQRLAVEHEAHQQTKEELAQKLEAAVKQREKEQVDLEKTHQAEVKSLEQRLAGECEAHAQSLAQLEEGVEEKLAQGNVQMEQLKSQLCALEKSMAEDKAVALCSQYEDLVSQRNTALQEQKEALHAQHKADVDRLRQEQKTQLADDLSEHKHRLTDLHKADLDQMRDELTEARRKEVESLRQELAASHLAAVVEQRENLTKVHMTQQAELEARLLQEHKDSLAQVLEEKQLEYAQKLTELKMQFDMEREGLLRELHRYKDHVMTHSETQTGLELLAEVISLTSSTSYGSEEMIANRQPPSFGEDKDSQADTNSKVQQNIEDLTTQLADAQETISNLNTELASARSSMALLKSQYCGQDKAMVEPALPLSPTKKGVTAELAQSSMTDTTTSFILMDSDQSASVIVTKEMKMKDEKIAELEKKVMEMSVTTLERDSSCDKVSIKGCDQGDLVLLCLDERHNQYVVFTVGTNLHFLHSDSLEPLGLRTDTDTSRKTWILAEVVDKEYCLAKKPNNRFRVPQGTCFYRVRCKAWRCDGDLTKAERDLGKPKLARADSKGTRSKKSEKK